MTIKMANIITIICVLLIGSTQVTFASDVDVTLKSSSGIVDVCQPELKREVIVSVNIGSVSKTDELFGYELQLKFKKGKIKFFETLKVNTLSEPCKYIIDEFTDSTANIQGLMGSVNIPMSGNKALLAIVGYYTDICPDSTDIEIEYFSPVDGYKNTIKNFYGTKIYANIADKADRYLTAGFKTDSTAVHENTTVVDASYKTNPELDSRLSSVDFELSGFNTKNIDLSEIVPVTENTTIDKLVQVGEKYNFTINYNGKNNVVEFKIYFKTITDEDYSNTIVLNPVKVNNCACITRFYSGSISINCIKDTVVDSTTSVENNENISCNFYKILTRDNFIYLNDILIDNSIEIFDINGNKFENASDFNISQNDINIERLSKGTYFCTYRNIKNENKKIMLIKY
jgi:hypothetical protein